MLSGEGLLQGESVFYYGVESILAKLCSNSIDNENVLLS